MAGNADCIVSGDKHLLAIRSHSGIPILSPDQFMRWLEIGND